MTSSCPSPTQTRNSGRAKHCLVVLGQRRWNKGGVPHWGSRLSGKGTRPSYQTFQETALQWRRCVRRGTSTALNSVLRIGYYPVAEPPLAIHLPICNKLQNFLRSLQPILKNVIHSHKIHLPLPHTLHF